MAKCRQPDADRGKQIEDQEQNQHERQIAHDLDENDCGIAGDAIACDPREHHGHRE
jgi:hypothetical protein